MAYQTGTITGPDALVSALSTFMTGNGWTLLDTLAADDLVFKSSGSSGKFPMIMRVMSSARTTFQTHKILSHPMRTVPHVECRGYATWSTSLAVPTGLALATATSGGTIAAGTQAYRVSALGSVGETTAAAEVTIVTTGSTSTVTVSWNQVPGAVGYNVYGRTSGAELLLQTITGGNVTTYLDIGFKTPSGALPGSNTAHGGTGEYGLLGESMLGGGYQAANTFQTQIYNVRLDSANGPASPANPALCAWNGITANTDNSGPYKFLGDRLAVFPAPVNTTKLKIVDLVTGDFYYSSANPSGYVISGGVTNSAGNCWEAVYDTVNDKWVIYYMSSTNFTATDGMWKYDIDTDTHARVASVPWAAFAVGGFVLWDGADSLYCQPGGAQTGFYKYSISGNSWSTLAVCPAARSAANGTPSYAPVGGDTGNSQRGTGCYQWYVPSLLSGLPNDVIYTILADNSTVLYAYNVTTNVWNDTAHNTPNLVNPGGNSYVGQTFLTDGGPYLWNRPHITNYIYKMALSNIWGGFTLTGNPWDAGEYLSAPTILNHAASKVRVHTTSPSTYYFIGTQDSMTVAINSGNLGHYYWMYFGRSTTRRRTSIMTTTTSSYGPGTNIAVTVDNTANYAVGEKILFFDASTGNLEQTKIITVNSSTSLNVTLVKAYTVGSFAGIDPFQTVVAGDSGFAVAPTDQVGYKNDLESAWYFMSPMAWPMGAPTGTNVTATSLWNSTATDGDSYFQPTEPVIWFASMNDPSQLGSQISRKGYYGTIPNVYFLPYSTSQGPQATDTLGINGHNYLVIPMRTTNKLPNWQMSAILGPIN